MKTDERDAIDKRVKEMSEKREDLFFLFSNDLFLHRLCFYINTILLVQNSPNSIFLLIFHIFLFNNILVVHFYFLAYLYHLLLVLASCMSQNR
jgi:hypothetical protein